MLKIEKGIKIPAIKGKFSIYLPVLRKMKIGDSFQIDVVRKHNVAQIVSQAKRRLPEFKHKLFTSRTITDENSGKKTVRVWRIK